MDLIRPLCASLVLVILSSVRYQSLRSVIRDMRLINSPRKKLEIQLLANADNRSSMPKLTVSAPRAFVVPAQYDQHQ